MELPPPTGASEDPGTTPDPDAELAEGLEQVPDAETGPARGFDEWRRRSVTGAVMTGIALGLQEALQRPREQPAIVITADDGSDEPPKAIELQFDPDNPSATVAVIRPWLRDHGHDDPG